MKNGLGLFLLGLALAIPLSIIANLLTPRIQQWWASTSRSRKLKRIDAIKEELATIASRSVKDEILWRASVILIFLALVFVSMAMMVFSEPIMSHGIFYSADYTLRQINITIVGGRVMALIGVAGVCWIAMSLLNLRDSYSAQLRDELSKLLLELSGDLRQHKKENDLQSGFKPSPPFSS
jgi:hypothetical protein